MEDARISENTTRSSQSGLTPPMTDPPPADLGYLADTEAAKRILVQGNYEIPVDLDPYAAILLQEMSMPESLQEMLMPESLRNQPLVSLKVTTEDHMLGWTKQKESISADPKG
jgi:hypothetical protein